MWETSTLANAKTTTAGFTNRKRAVSIPDEEQEEIYNELH